MATDNSLAKPEHHHVGLREAVGGISGESFRIAVKPAHQHAGLIGESTRFVKDRRIEHGFDGHGKRCACGDRPLGLLVELRVILALSGDGLVEITQRDRESDQAEPASRIRLTRQRSQTLRENPQNDIVKIVARH